MDARQDEQFFAVLNGGHIRTVYQPIFSLQNGNVLGYEALSRICLPECELNIEQLFGIAKHVHKIWELEKLCRTNALENAAKKVRNSKLFINVDPNVIYDPELRAGFTHEKLEEYGLNPDDLVFEITERSAIGEMESFTASITHYQKQNFKIAIDDFGAGYSGLSRVCALRPNFIKLDMAIVRDIHKFSNKSSLVSGIVKFCKEMNIALVAEGIETEAELDTLIRLGVDYGQGYYLGQPQENFVEPPVDLKLAIKEKWSRAAAFVQQLSVFGTVDSICRHEEAVSANVPAVEVFQQMQQDEHLGERFVVNPDGTVCGMLTRKDLFGCFGVQFGDSPSLERRAGQLARSSFLQVERSTTIDNVARLAMERDPSCVYDSVAVTDHDLYYGTVSVRDLLMAAIRIRLQRVTKVNPLTDMPGNAVVQRAISLAMKEARPFSIIYLDLDNFKAYNDAFGFANGDRMIKILGDTIQTCCLDQDLKGHIGGDDFVIVSPLCQEETIQSLCERIVCTFSQSIRSLYNDEDVSRGDIISQNRHGFTEKFRGVTLSIAVLTSDQNNLTSMEELSQAVVKAKKKSKQILGNSIVSI